VLRNFAIIAHIDHGKTTLVDRLLAQCGAATSEDRVMDSGALEKERGITITAKSCSVHYKGHHLNIVDTPGHADFGGEVERVLGMVDGCVLLVDAAEGPLAQTKFVMEKTIRMGHRLVVVLNKVDRPAATPEQCGAIESRVFDLLHEMGATEEQLDFPVVYASAKQGWATLKYPENGAAPAGASMAPLLDTIIQHIPPPTVDLTKPWSLSVAMVGREPYLGRVLTGRVATGKVKVGDRIKILPFDARGIPTDTATETAKVTKIFKRAGGLSRLYVDEAIAGDIVSITGSAIAGIADTIGSPNNTVLLPPGHIDPPTLAMVFGANDSPLAGRSGKAAAGRVIGERLLQEAEVSVSLRVNPMEGSGEKWEVQARGELQLGVLLESLRREGLELAVSPPRVLLKKGEETGKMLEPFEDVVIEVSEEISGTIIDAMNRRKADLMDMVTLESHNNSNSNEGGHGAGGGSGNNIMSNAAHGGNGSNSGSRRQRLTFFAPSRGLIGFKSFFVTLTRGEGILSRAFVKYAPHRGPFDGVRKGLLISTAEGKTTTYALGELQSRGSFFVDPGMEVYTGMIIGESSRDDDMEINPVKEKRLTNVRSVVAEEKVYLLAPKVMTLEESIGYVAGDELIEVTPTAIRLRKEILDPVARKSKNKRDATLGL